MEYDFQRDKTENVSLVTEHPFESVIGFQEAVAEQNRRLALVRKIKIALLSFSILVGGIFFFMPSNFNGPLSGQESKFHLKEGSYERNSVLPFMFSFKEK